ncbi:MAG: MurR/RpiR family transcriptional regulator [Clostridia bacterium]|jgi:DNA-binding MurR/RpiR family transcriptional regulator|nr:MurR/RpiR family transcriptional regulator [Clostridia bacterium]
MDILKTIEESMKSFSKGQRAIARYMLEHYDKAAYMTALRLGSEVNVSESTVVRFAIELGFEGYPELQKSLRELIRSRLTTLQRIEIANDRIGDDEVLEKVVNYDIEKLKITLESVDKAAFEKAVDTVISAKRIFIMGVRSSASLAQFMNFYFTMMFDNVKLVSTTSRSEVFEQLFRIGPDDVMIGITFPRYSKRVTDALEFASSKGAKTIALTDSNDSPAAENADCVLVARSDMASFADSLVAPLSIINAMTVAIGKKKEKELTDTFNEFESIWEQYEVYDKSSR